jgi:hypothetical protein
VKATGSGEERWELMRKFWGIEPFTYRLYSDTSALVTLCFQLRAATAGERIMWRVDDIGDYPKVVMVEVGLKLLCLTHPKRPTVDIRNDSLSQITCFGNAVA